MFDANVTHIPPQEINTISETLVEHFISLSRESMEMRFFTHKTLEAIKGWVEHISNSNNYQNHWLLQLNDEAKILCAGHLSIDKYNIGEISISVLDNEQGRGFGKEMLNCLMIKAKELKCKEIKVCCLPINRKIINLLKNKGFEMTFIEGTVYGFLNV